MTVNVLDRGPDRDRGVGSRERFLDAMKTMTPVIPHDTPARESPQPAPVTRGPSHEAVLIVDDVAAMRRLLARILATLDMEVMTAGDAAEAREMLRHRRIDLMLCDLMMPGEPGQSLIRYAVHSHPEMAVVVVSGVSEPGEAAQVLMLGVQGYLIKPFDKNQVLITVSNALRLRELERLDRIRREQLEREVQSKTHDLIDLHETLRERQREMQRQTLSLRDASGAVRTLLDQRPLDRSDFEAEIVENVRQSIQPFIQRLKKTMLSPLQEQYLASLETGLQHIISPFIKAISSSYLNLTPTELQVADQIRQGKRTKDIAANLNLSPNTIMTHRYHLRKKLGLKNNRVSLSTYLKTLE